MLDVLFTSFLTSLLTLLGAWFFLYQPAKVASVAEPVNTKDEEEVTTGETLELEESDEEWYLKESGHERREVNASVSDIDAVRRSFARDKPPHLEGGKGKAKARASSRIQCRQCDKDFADQVALKQHRAFKHSGAGSSLGGLPSTTPSEQLSSSSTRFACDVCNKEHRTPTLLRAHKADDHPWSIYCVKCRVKFKSAHQATQHYKTSSAHMPRLKRSSPRKPVESGNYVPFEGFNPDPNIPEVQQTYGCGECKERFNSAAERDAHMRDIFVHPDPISLAAAFPPLSSTHPASPGPSSPAPASGLGLGLEISSRHGIALDRIHLPFEHVERREREVIEFDDGEEAAEEVVETVILMEVDEPAPVQPIETAVVEVTIDEPGPLLDPVELVPDSILPEQSASNIDSQSSRSDSPPPESTMTISSPTTSDRSIQPWYSPAPISPSQVHPDASIVWGVPWSPPVPGPESYPPLDNNLPTPTTAIWGPPISTPHHLASPRPSESTVEETPPPETPPPAPSSPKEGITPSRWSIGEKPAFPMPDLTPRIKQKLSFDPPPPVEEKEERKPDDITAPYIHPARLSLPPEEPPLVPEEIHDPYEEDNFPIAISGANSVPLSYRRSKANHYRMGPAGDYPATQITVPLPHFQRQPRPPPRSSQIEEQVPHFRQSTSGGFMAYPPPGPTPAPPRAAALSAWSKAPKQAATPASYEPTVHSSWLPTPPSTSSSSSDDARGPRGRKNSWKEKQKDLKKFHNILEPAFDADEWTTDPVPTPKKKVVKMQPRKESPAPPLTFAQRTAAAAAAAGAAGKRVFPVATDAYGKKGGTGPVGSSGWAAQQATATTAGAGDSEDYGGW